jgi:hypothetical protein
MTIILYIIIQQILDDYEEIPKKKVESPPIKIENKIKEVNYNNESDVVKTPYSTNEPRVDEVTTNQGNTVTQLEVPEIINESNEAMSERETFTTDLKEQKTWTFNKPNPWSQIVYVPEDEYPFYFHIKIKIPSLNDYQIWRNIVPNINFNPKTGEIVIPSRDEPSALALANLMIINYSGKMSMDNIIKNKLIQISVSKAKSHKVVQIKLREQIMDNLYGTKFNASSNFHQDLAMNKPKRIVRDRVTENAPQRVDFSSEQFTDTFEHFSEQPNKSNDIEAYDGSDYTYL